MLELRNICKRFPDFEIRDVNFTVNSGDYFVMLGLSGSGKTLLLEIIAGLCRADSGNVFVDNVDITHEKIQNRGVGLLFQDFALFPHLTVKQNIAYPLKSLKISKSEMQERIQKIASDFSFAHLLNKYPQVLSGGEKQRVALARSLVLSPKILLLDEPLASVDIVLRHELRSLLRNLNRSGQTILHVSHDIEEVISLANHVAVINKGQIEQVGKPKVIFQNPKSQFVANLSGIRNFFEATVAPQENGEAQVATCTNGAIVYLLTEHTGPGWLTVQSNDLIISIEKPESSALNVFHGVIIDIFPSTRGVEITVDTELIYYAVVTKNSSRALNLAIGKSIWISYKASAVKFIPK